MWELACQRCAARAALDLESAANLSPYSLFACPPDDGRRILTHTAENSDARCPVLPGHSWSTQWRDKHSQQTPMTPAAIPPGPPELANEGELPSGMLRDEIDASWRRSLSHGLDCLQGEQVGLGIRHGLDLRALLEHNRLLIDAVTPELDYLVRRQGQSGIVILGDAQANVLAIEGQKHALEREGLRDLHPGSCWSEALRGTNAIGTAVVEGQPTLINCGEHYLDRLSPFSCTSVPLRARMAK
jgi:hypothetical protein